MKSIPFDFKSGILQHCSWEVKSEIPLAEQMYEFGQDLIQVKFEQSGVVMDIAWAQQGKADRGRFVLCLARGKIGERPNWEEPLLEKMPRTFQGLKKAVEAAVNLAEEIEQKEIQRAK